MVAATSGKPAASKALLTCERSASFRLLFGTREPQASTQSKLLLPLPGSNSAPLQLSTDGLRPFSIQNVQVAQ